MRRAGFTVPEVLVALSLAGLVSAMAAGLLQSQSRVTANALERAHRAEAFRTAAHVLTTETRWLSPESDVRAVTADSFALRAFRGTGVVCVAEPGSALLRYRGLRAPDPAKDSVLILRDTIYEAVVALEGAAPAGEGCSAAPAEQLQRIAVAPPLQAGDVVAVFESGAYYLSGNALRYRLGAEGRQPVTAELFEERGTGFARMPGPYSQAVLTARDRPRAARLRSVVRLIFGSALTP